MMTDSAIEILMSEHRVIESVLDALDLYAKALAKGDEVAREDLPLFIRFLKEFADAKHHAKEERILFVAMHESGFPRESGPVACMLGEHVSGRALVGALDECANESPWTDDVIKRIVSASLQFSGLLRAHIYKEDNMLYQMAKTRLSSEQMGRVDALCAKEDLGNVEAGITRELEKLAAQLTGRYGASAPQSVSSGQEGVA